MRHSRESGNPGQSRRVGRVLDPRFRGDDEKKGEDDEEKGGGDGNIASFHTLSEKCLI
jgi:hypothetical protein